jgi:hypothetical protein
VGAVQMLVNDRLCAWARSHSRQSYCARQGDAVRRIRMKGMLCSRQSLV